MADLFLMKAKENGYNIRITEGFRSKEKQEEYYQQGRTKPGPIITNAQYPKSLHNHGLAFDICFVGNKPYPNDDNLWYNLSVIGKSIGLEAGYDFMSFKDRPHYQYRGGYKYEDIYNFNYSLEDFDVKEEKKTKTLIDAIIQVESNSNDWAIGDHHLTNKAYGCMQIRLPVCIDVNRRYGTSIKPEDMLGNRQLSIDTFNKYMDIYCKGKNDEYKARVWNGGPTGYLKPATVEYWNKVKKILKD